MLDTEAHYMKLKSDPLGRIVLRVFEQQARLSNLASHANAEIKDPELRDEILRALVVFTHAALEDTVREVVRRRWRDWPDELIDKLPFPGSRSPKASHKDLRAFIGLSVEELIETSANEYLDTKSISSTNELCSLLSTIGFDLDQKLKELAKVPTWAILGIAALESLIRRRHNIVHNDDYNQSYKCRNGIDLDTVLNWIANAMISCLALIQFECDRHDDLEVPTSISEILMLILRNGPSEPTAQS
jgi:hypothetical protein